VSSTRERGRDAERRAADHLRVAGLRIIAQNVEAAGGEIDLICESTDPGEPPTIVFVEVRSRASGRLGHPLQTIGAAKRRHLIRAATGWLVAEDLWEKVAVRFDVVTMTGEEIEWLRDAFSAS
jgi:putative endonuclease